MKKFLHVGYPKTASTSIQAALSHQDQVYYLGKGIGDGGGFVDRGFKKALRTMVLEANELAYDPHKFSDILETHIEAAIDGEFSSIGMSEEGILIPPNQPSFPVPITTRIKRLSDLFGSDTTVVLTIREQLSWLRSWYRESLKWGVDYSFDTFCRYLLLRKQFWILPLLDYGCVINTLNSHFDDLHVFLFEDFITNEQTQREFFAACNVDFSGDLPKENVDTPHFSAVLYYLNKIFSYKESRGGVLDLNFEDLSRLQWSDSSILRSGGLEREYRRQRRKRVAIYRLGRLIERLGIPRITNLSKQDKFMSVKPDVERELNRIFSEYNQTLVDDYDLPIDKFGYEL